MKNLLVLLVLTAFAATAFAGGNPQVQAYISFDSAGAPVHTYTSTPFVSFNAYFVLSCLDLGMTTVSFRLSDPSVTCAGAYAPPAFTNLLPGDLAIGTWNGGITIASTECMTGDVVVGALNLFPITSAPCYLNILDHPEFPRWVVDCNDPGLVDFYCVLANGSIDGGTAAPGEDCPCGSPVEDSTWGGIKALYR